MAAVLKIYLKNAGYDVVVESAGVLESAKQDGGASKFAIVAASVIGLDVSCHKRRHINSLNLDDYDLFVCATDEIAFKLVEAGVDRNKMFNAHVKNPWPLQFQQDYEPTMIAILGAMYKVVARYFPARRRKLFDTSFSTERR